MDGVVSRNISMVDLDVVTSSQRGVKRGREGTKENGKEREGTKENGKGREGTKENGKGREGTKENGKGREGTKGDEKGRTKEDEMREESEAKRMNVKTIAL
jgi:hypothetical protein